MKLTKLRAISFYDKIAPRMGKGKQKFYLNTLSFAGKLSGTILEIGCASGRLLKLIKEQYETIEPIGIDISEKLCKIAKKRSKCDIIRCDAQHLPLKPFFKFVFMTEVLEHLLEPERAIKEISKILKGKDAKLVLTVPNSLRLVKLLGIAKNPWVQPIDRDFTFYEVRKLLSRNGFNIDDREASGPIVGGKLDSILSKIPFSFLISKRLRIRAKIARRTKTLFPTKKNLHLSEIEKK